MRWLAVLVLVGACGDDTSPWRPTHVDGATDVNFFWATGAGEQVWALGADTDGVTTTLGRFDGTSWQALPIELQPVAIHAVAEDELLVTDRYVLWRTSDGVTWTRVDTGITGQTNRVWGSAPDDVWVTTEDDPARLFHWDGVAWTRLDGWEGLVPARSALDDGCDTGPSDVWLSVRVMETVPWTSHLLHWDGSSWADAGPPLPGNIAVTAIECRGSQVWVTDIDRAFRRDGASWDEFALPDANGVYALAVGADGTAWIAGDQLDGAESQRPQIWQIDGAQATRTLSGQGSELNAIWTTDAGRTFAFRADGLVLDRE